MKDGTRRFALFPVDKAERHVRDVNARLFNEFARLFIDLYERRDRIARNTVDEKLALPLNLRGIFFEKLGFLRVLAGIFRGRRLGGRHFGRPFGRHFGRHFGGHFGRPFGRRVFGGRSFFRGRLGGFRLALGLLRRLFGRGLRFFGRVEQVVVFLDDFRIKDLERGRAVDLLKEGVRIGEQDLDGRRFGILEVNEIIPLAGIQEQVGPFVQFFRIQSISPPNARG